MNKSSVCVLIPAYNEEKRIGGVIEEVQRRGFKVIAVDDGSTDGTAQAIKNSGADFISSTVNEGKGAAIRKGFDWVVQNDYAAVIVMDADGQHSPDQLDDFLRALGSGDADVVVGNRMNDPKGMPLIRRCTNRGMSGVISLIAGQTVPDTQCGYRALTQRALQKIRLHTDRFEIESEMLMVAGRKGLRIKSVPIVSVYNDETSHIRPWQDTIRFMRFLFKFIFMPRER